MNECTYMYVTYVRGIDVRLGMIVCMYICILCMYLGMYVYVCRYVHIGMNECMYMYACMYKVMMYV